jgi:hypothetical protein
MHHIHGMVRMKLQLWCLRFEFRPSLVEVKNGHEKQVDVRLGHRPSLVRPGRFTLMFERFVK